MEKSEALRLADLHGEIESMRAERMLTKRRLSEVQAQRDALLEKINGVLAAERSEGSGRDGFINKSPTREYQRRVAQAWQELHAAVKAVAQALTKQRSALQATEIERQRAVVRGNRAESALRAVRGET